MNNYIPKEWKNSSREDIKLAQYAKDIGFTVDFRKEEPGVIPCMPLTFTKENKTIWEAIKHNEIVWMCAEIINNKYTNHRHYKSLSQALNTEK